MGWVQDHKAHTDNISGTEWVEREGRKVPLTTDVALGNGAVRLDATFLYADLAGSSRMAAVCPWQTTAKIIRAFIDAATRRIRAHEGHIRSFDGDRVMGVFIGDRKNTRASEAARELDYVVDEIIGPKARSRFTSVTNNDVKIRHAVGIDTGIVRAVRAGIRRSNDLIWVGRAPSLAAKLSDVRSYPYSTFVSDRVYKKLAASEKAIPWEKKDFAHGGKTEIIYRTKQVKDS